VSTSVRPEPPLFRASQASSLPLTSSPPTWRGRESTRRHLGASQVPFWRAVRKRSAPPSPLLRACRRRGLFVCNRRLVLPGLGLNWGRARRSSSSRHPHPRTARRLGVPCALRWSVRHAARVGPFGTTGEGDREGEWTGNGADATLHTRHTPTPMRRERDKHVYVNIRIRLHTSYPMIRDSRYAENLSSTDG